MPKKTSAKDIRGRDKLHPRSRKATQLQRASLRVDKLDNRRTKRISTLIFPLLDRISWFQLVVDPQTTHLALPEIRDLIRQYLARLDDELEAVLKTHRPGRPIPRRADEIRLVQKTEKEEYERAGFEMPDLTNIENVAALRRWDGTRESLNLVKLVRVKP